MPVAVSSAFEWNSERLEPLRQVGDPLADAVIADVFQNGGVAGLNALMRSFVANEYTVPDGVSPAVRAYLSQAPQLPAWAQPELIEAGEQVFWRFGPRIILTLFFYGLPFTYLGKNGVPVLTLTTRLVSNPTRRIAETAQMVIDVMQPGGITDPGGRGLLSVQKVRLMHAAVRHLAPTAPTWDKANGLPVNQEDLAGTLMGFSWIILDGLRKIGIELTDADQEAYIHFWSVIGHLLGVRDELLPSSVAEAQQLTTAISDHQFGPTPDGKELTSALVQMVAHILPGNLFDRVPALFVRYFMGRQSAEWLGIGDDACSGFVAAPLRFVGHEFCGVLEDSKALGMIAEKVGHLLIESILCIERGGNRPSFAIPAELRQQWGVNWTS